MSTGFAGVDGRYQILSGSFGDVQSVLKIEFAVIIVPVVFRCSGKEQFPIIQGMECGRNKWVRWGGEGNFVSKGNVDDFDKQGWG